MTKLKLNLHCEINEIIKFEMTFKIKTKLDTSKKKILKKNFFNKIFRKNFLKKIFFKNNFKTKFKKISKFFFFQKKNFSKKIFFKKFFSKKNFKIN